MAEKIEKNAPTEASAKPAPRKRVVNLFYDGERYKAPVFVQVNGKNIMVKRNEDVEVEEKYAHVLDNSRHQNAATADLCNRLQAECRLMEKMI